MVNSTDHQQRVKWNHKEIPVYTSGVAKIKKIKRQHQILMRMWDSYDSYAWLM